MIDTNTFKRRRKSVTEAVRRPIEVLPLRVRLVALLVSLLLVALTLTSFATSALMRRQLMDNTDSDLVAAAVPTASRVVRSFGAPDENLPTNYAVKLMPTDPNTVLGPPRFLLLPAGDHLLPNIPNLTLSDPRVVNGTLFTVNSINGDMRWRVLAGPVTGGSATGIPATYAVAVPLRGIDTTVARMLTF